MKNYITSITLVSILFFSSFATQPAFAMTFTRHDFFSDCGKTVQGGHDDNNNNNCNVNNNTNNNSNSQSQGQSQGQEQNNNQTQNFNPEINNNNNNTIKIGAYARPIPAVYAAPQIVSLPSTGTPLSDTLMLLSTLPLGLLFRKLKK